MAIHELTTNAVKHGALSVLGGSVEVIWDLDAEATKSGSTGWSGTARPWNRRPGAASPPTPPAGPDESIDARPTIDFDPEGVRIHIVLPFKPRPTALMDGNAG